jgi:hypothetical protein
MELSSLNEPGKELFQVDIFMTHFNIGINVLCPGHWITKRLRSDLLDIERPIIRELIIGLITL